MIKFDLLTSWTVDTVY